jgi:PAS domain S-box-containing protein
MDKELKIKELMNEITLLKSQVDHHNNESVPELNSFLESITYISQQLILGKSWETNIIKVIASIGETIDYSQVSLFNFTSKTKLDKVVHWKNHSHMHAIRGEDFKEIDLQHGNLARYMNIMQNGAIIKGSLKDFPTQEKVFLSEKNIKTFVVIPIVIKQKVWGIIWLHNCIAEKQLNENEISYLKKINTIIEASIRVTKTYKDLTIERDILNEFYNKTNEAIALINESGIVLKINKEFSKLFGYEESEIIGENIDQTLPTQQNTSDAILLTQAIIQGKKTESEGIRKPKQGLPVYVNIQGFPIHIKNDKTYVIAVYRNITEKKIKERQLLESRIKYKTLYENAPNAIILLKSDTIIDCNQKACELFKEPKNRIVGESIDFFSVPVQENGRISHEMAMQYINRALNGESVNFEWIHRSSDNKSIPTEIILNKIQVEENLYVQGIIRDITKRRKNEKDLLEAKQRAEESDKLKTAFLAHISHEIRTPLNHILGSVDLITDPELPVESQLEFKSIIKQSSGDLLNLINNIIDISMIESDQLEFTDDKINIEDLTNSIQVFFDKALKKYQRENLNFQISIPEICKNEEIRTDFARFEQILNNLIDNAVKFTEKGTIEIGCINKETVIMFWVKDTGIGIENNKFEIIFDRFRQIDFTHTREYGGTGLGLAICKELLKIMGGDIWIESELDVGTTFFFTLPRKKQLVTKSNITKSSQKIEGPEIIKDDYKWTDKKILIVEDEDMNVQYLKTILAKTGVNIEVAYNGIEAIKKINTTEYNLVLMDIQLPEMDGYETTKQIKKIKPDLVIIAQTAHALSNDKLKCYEAGCDGYLSKPLKRRKLLELINSFF